MKDRKLATRYARALLSSISDPLTSEKADQFLTALASAMEESDEFRDVMLDPAIPAAARKAVLQALAEQSDMSPQVVNFMATVVDHNRAASLPSIAEVFHEEHEAEMGIVPAQVVTAAPLSDDLKQRTLRALEQVTGRKVRLSANVEPDILGGAVTRIGSKVYDGSLRTQLAQLRRKMMQE